jgi:hypothetical protein
MMGCIRSMKASSSSFPARTLSAYAGVIPLRPVVIKVEVRIRVYWTKVSICSKISGNSQLPTQPSDTKVLINTLVQ